MKTRAASSSGVFYEAFCGAAAKYEAQLTLHEAALRAMKRILTASCFFALESRQKNGRPFSLNSEFSLKLKMVAS
ncbi:MAG: hypothetical protein IJY46_03080 [Lentisphaeria bacterium]|nr:hypothetical protein [Lentisphaeria bacterium]